MKVQFRDSVTGTWMYTTHLMLSNVIRTVFENGADEFVLPVGRSLKMCESALQYLRHHCGRANGYSLMSTKTPSSSSAAAPDHPDLLYSAHRALDPS